MKSPAIVSTLFSLLIFFSTPIFSDNESDRVADWTSNVLINTLSVNADNLPTQLKQSKVYYTKDAWDALSSFLSYLGPVIKDQQLTLHPKALNAPTVVNSGEISGIRYWRINQSINIPEVSTQIDFSVVVIKASNPPYLIQSLNMLKSKN